MLVRGRKLSPADARAYGRRLPLPGLPAAQGFGSEETNDMTDWNALRGSTRRVALGIALAALAVASVQTAAAEISIIGKWQIVEAVPAPWSKPEEQAELAAEGKRMLKTEVTFAPGSLTSKFKPFNCKSKVLYEANSI